MEHQGRPSEASGLWSSSLEAEPEAGIQLHMAGGGRAFWERECGKHSDEEAAKPGCVSGEDLASSTDALSESHTTAEPSPRRTTHSGSTGGSASLPPGRGGYA